MVLRIGVIRDDVVRESSMPRMLMSVFALMAALLLPAAEAGAQSTGYTTADVNMRAGPSTEYPRVIVLPEGGEVEVFGCVRGYTWCDVAYFQYRGWVSSRYISIFYDNYSYVPYRPIVPVPIITFDFGYWDRWYPSYPWYSDYRWRRTYRDWDDYRPRRNDPPRRNDVIIYPRGDVRNDPPRRNDRIQNQRTRGDIRTESRRNDRDVRVDRNRNERNQNAQRRRNDGNDRVNDNRRRNNERVDDNRRRNNNNGNRRNVDRRPTDGTIFDGGTNNGLRCAFGDPRCVR
jgi:uncharacterized protein YraI